MKAFVIILLMVTAQGSVLVTDDISITEYLYEYSIQVGDLPEDLSSYTIIVISTPLELFEEKDITSIKTFVESGGGLMLLAEENNQNGTTLVLNQISQEFSITFNTDRIYDDQNYYEDVSWITLSKLPSHPVFQGVTTIVYTAGCSLSLEGDDQHVLVKSSPQAYAEKYDGLVTYGRGSLPACMVFAEFGEGRIFACGDKELFDTHLTFGDNLMFALNVFDWLSSNPDRIQKRLTDKNEAVKAIPEAKLAVQSADEKGLRDVLPQSVVTAQSLISEAEALYDSYKYSEALQKARQAQQSIKDGEEKAEKMVTTRVRAAQECLSEIENGAQKYHPSQLEAALYYFNEIESQKTYVEKMEKADESLALCEEIRTGLKGAAQKEIDIAREKIESYKGLFGRTSHHSARVHLEYAEESFESGKFGDAITFAQQSQDYSDVAAEEHKKDYILAVAVILIGALAVYIYVRK